MRRTLVFLGAVLMLTETGMAATSASVSQYGITWTFDKAYTVGQFANGDWWVVGPVVITGITPAFDGTRHGWEVNPSSRTNQGFDSRTAGGFNASLVPGLPYTAAPGKSIVKALSLTNLGDDGWDTRLCLKTAAVLTVLAAVPPDNGATVFRPPYFGTNKPLYSTLGLHTELLPSLAPVANTPGLATMTAKFQRVQIDHQTDWSGGYLHPVENMETYGAAMASTSADAALRLMLNDPLSAKKPLLINYIQLGIDLYAMQKGGVFWLASGGTSVGRKLPIAFAAVLLDNQAMKDAVYNAAPAANKTFDEDWSIRAGQGGRGLFGQMGWGSSEQTYWNAVYSGSSTNGEPDPYGYIDGGSYAGAGYVGVVAQPYKGQAIVMHLMPQLKTVWNNQAFIDFVDRWVTVGVWAQPDPCAPYDGNQSNYGVTFGPDGHGGCIRDTKSGDGIGRFPARHGTQKDGGVYGSYFIASMWAAYRSMASHAAAPALSQRQVPEIGLFPNPMHDRMTITVTTTEQGTRADVKIYNSHGQLMHHAIKTEKNWSVEWNGAMPNGERARPGTYFYVVKTENNVSSGNFIVLP
jgi:hypothetical protein